MVDAIPTVCIWVTYVILVTGRLSVKKAIIKFIRRAGKVIPNPTEINLK